MIFNWIKKHPFLTAGGVGAGLYGLAYWWAGKVGDELGRKVGGSFFGEATNPQEQCKALLTSGDTLLACRYKHGHSGKHKTVYVNGREWT